MPARDGTAWIMPALALVAAVTAARLILLAFDRTDPFVDEVQYWLWGQSLDWGYYSKPPLIAWVLRAVTDLAGSDAPFWLRSPGAVLHGVTALILAGLAARMYGAGAALWVAAGYVTLPMVTVGSLLFSTDTVMVPFLAAALWFWHRAATGGRVGDAALAGACAGLAALAKYAGVYLLPGLAVAALLSPAWRVPLRHWGMFLATFAIVLSPNVLWNLSHDLTTLAHTADNAAWVRGGVSPSPLALARFWAEQFAVAGPLVAGAFVLALWRFRPGDRALAGFAALVLAVVSVQALLGGANANWAVVAWLPGTVVAMVAMSVRLRVASLAVNGAVALALPILTLFPTAGPEGNPLLQRWLGRADLSRQIIAAAGEVPIVADRRDVLADLFYTGRGQGLVIYARPYAGRPRHYYEQMHSLPAGLTGDVLLVSDQAGPCALAPPQPLSTDSGAYAGSGLSVWRVKAACLYAN